MAELPSASSSISHRPGIAIVLLTLVVHAALVLFRHSEVLIWDEHRYLEYARNLTQGFYVTDEEPNFVNGPAYPILLAPFISLPSGLLAARLLNALFMAGAAGFVWLAVRPYAGAAWAACGALFIAFHPTLLWMSFAVMTEPMSTFLWTGFLWTFTQALRSHRWPWAWAAAGFFAGLIMTRVFFGHVLMATAFLAAALLLIREWRPALRRALAVLGLSFVFCTPYLAYTQAKTGQFLCWSTNSGELLYWLTSHHEGENGHWFGREDVRDMPEIHATHKQLYQDLFDHPILEREKRYKEAAIAQVKKAPARVAYNWLCNLTRLAFGFPRSHHEEELRNIVLIVTNGPLILFSVAAGLVGMRFWRTLPVEIWLVVAMTAFYLGGSTLAPCLPRYFVLMVPALWLGLACVFKKHIRVTLTGGKE